MSANDAMMLVIFLWFIWFFAGGAWAVFRLLIGLCGFRNGESKWSGLKSMFVWAIVNIPITVWAMSLHGG